MRAAGVRRNRAVEERPNTIFVGNIPYGVTEQQLYKLFHRFGKITKHQYLWHRKGEKRGVPKGFCFVEYEKQESSTRARLAMNGRMLCGRKLVVSNAQRKVGIMDKNGVKRGDLADDRKSRDSSNASNDDKIRAIRRKLANMERTSHAKSRVHEAIAKQSVSLAPSTFTLTPAAAVTAAAASSPSSSSSKKRKRQKCEDVKGSEREDDGSNQNGAHQASSSSSSSPSKKRKRQEGEDARGDEGEGAWSDGSCVRQGSSSSSTFENRQKVLDTHGEDGAALPGDSLSVSDESMPSSSEVKEIQGASASLNDACSDNMRQSLTESGRSAITCSSNVLNGGHSSATPLASTSSSQSSNPPLALTNTDEGRLSASSTSATSPISGVSASASFSSASVSASSSSATSRISSASANVSLYAKHGNSLSRQETLHVERVGTESDHSSKQSPRTTP